MVEQESGPELNLYYVGFHKHGSIQSVIAGPWFNEQTARDELATRRRQARQDGGDPGSYVLAFIELTGTTYILWVPEEEDEL